MCGAAGCSRMTGAALLCRRVARLGGAAAGLCLLLTQQAAAFPISDAESPSIVPSADASDSSDASALAHQLSLLNGYSSSVGPGWTFTPSLTLQEALNDNVFDTSTNRQWDLITYLIPSLAIYGDTQNVQLRFNYQPTVEYYARNTSLNQLAEQLNATADVTCGRTICISTCARSPAWGRRRARHPAWAMAATPRGRPRPADRT